MTDIQRRAVFEAGLTLQAVQVAEHQITFCLTWVFPKDDSLRLHALYALDAKHQRLTLGRLVSELRERATIRDDFDQLLCDFITRRNRFAHKLFTEDQHVLENDASAARVTEFLLALQDIVVQVQTAFLGHLVQWGQSASNVSGLREFTDGLLRDNPRLQRIQRSHKDVIRRRRTV